MKTAITRWFDTHPKLIDTAPVAIIFVAMLCDIGVYIFQPGYRSIVDGQKMPPPPEWFAHLLADPFGSPLFTTITIAWAALNVLMIGLIAVGVVYNLSSLEPEREEDASTGPFDPAEDQGL